MVVEEQTLLTGRDETEPADSSISGSRDYAVFARVREEYEARRNRYRSLDRISVIASLYGTHCDEALTFLQEILQHGEEPEFRAVAALTLAGQSDRASVQALMKGLRDHNETVRLACFDTLAETARPARLRRMCETALKAGESPEIRESAVIALRKAINPGIRKWLCDQALYSDVPQLRDVAVTLLAEASEPECVETLHECLRQESVSTIRLKIAAGLQGRLDPRTSLLLARQWISPGSGMKNRMIAAVALKDTRTRECLKALEYAALNDKSRDVRALAVASLGGVLDEECIDTIKKVRKANEDNRDDTVRRAANDALEETIEALGKKPDPSLLWRIAETALSEGDLIIGWEIAEVLNQPVYSELRGKICHELLNGRKNNDCRVAAAGMLWHTTDETCLAALCRVIETEAARETDDYRDTELGFTAAKSLRETEHQPTLSWLRKALGRENQGKYAFTALHGTKDEACIDELCRPREDFRDVCYNWDGLAKILTAVENPKVREWHRTRCTECAGKSYLFLCDSARALAGADDFPSQEALFKVMTGNYGGDLTRGWDAANSLRECPKTPEMVSLLKNAAQNDRTKANRIFAIRALSGDPDAESVRMFTDLLTDEALDKEVRAEAAQALKDVPDANARRALRRIWAADWKEDVRDACRNALRKREKTNLEKRTELAKILMDVERMFNGED